MDIFLIYAFLQVLCVCGGSGQHAVVRLSSGWHGRVDIIHAGEEGSVCDDNWDNNDCLVVCRQIGLSGGLAVREASLQYGEGTGRIWLDDVNCAGTENYLDDCEHDFWGTHNCLHKEDAGCSCTKPPSVHHTAGTCDESLHRLVEFDAVQYPGVGRVEVRKSVSSSWYGVCDDQWDDVAAQVFCSCVGYTDVSAARAYWSPSLASMPSIGILYDSVNCDSSHVIRQGNLHDCQVVAASGRCDRQEAAGVACVPIPRHDPPEPPSVSLTCGGQQLSVCFTSVMYPLETQYLNTQPACLKAITSSSSPTCVCIRIDMEACDTATQQSDVSSKQYCYDISYSQYDTDPATLLMDQVWTRRACCEIAKNGSVSSSSFVPLTAAHPSVLAQAPTTFSLQCYSEETFSGAPLGFPAQVARGQDVFCRVSADTWDTNMYLVVPHCSFQATVSGTPAFSFHAHKCPTSAALGISYFSFDGHHWGFGFSMPKFQGYGDVYVVCSTYVCDRMLDSKPYCDRSCQAFSSSSGTRSRRDTQAGQAPIKGGPFHVVDKGSGPLISQNGTLTVTEISVQKSTSLKDQKFKQDQSSGHQTKQYEQAWHQNTGHQFKGYQSGTAGHQSGISRHQSGTLGHHSGISGHQSDRVKQKSPEDKSAGRPSDEVEHAGVVQSDGQVIHSQHWLLSLLILCHALPTVI